MAAILVVDDDAVMRRVISYMVRNLGHEALVADTARGAIEVLETQLQTVPCDLAILDITMPDMTGLELLAHLRSDARFATLPIIMLTASSHTSDYDQAQTAGAEVLTKPARSSELQEKIAKLLKL